MEVTSQVEGWGWLREHSLKGANIPQIAGRESRKRCGPAEEARDHCFRVHQERGSRALPKRVPRRAQAETISTDTRDGHEMLRRLLQPARSLCASTGHYSHLHPREPVQPTNARVPRSRDNFLGRTHSTPQAVAMSCWPLPSQAHLAFHTAPSPQPE